MATSLLRALRHRTKFFAYRLAHLGERACECPICAYRGPFRTLESSTGRRRHALCPSCGAFERHRLQAVVLEKLFDDLLRERNTRDMRMLHFAPEPFLSSYFRERFGRYESSDPVTPGVDHRFDIQALPCADGEYDFVFASHVLEHVADDQRAIREIRRILRPGGIAVLPVPIIAPQTVEYPEPNPHETFHVRAPGPDYFERYREAFPRVEVFGSSGFPERYQLYVYEDRTGWPTAECPLRPPMAGERHEDFVPVCHASPVDG